MDTLKEKFASLALPMKEEVKAIIKEHGDKKLGEFFEPITLRAATQVGMKYKLPNL